MSYNQIKQLRKEGKLEEAYKLAKAAFENNPDNIWNKRALAWVYNDLLKNAVERNLPDKVLTILPMTIDLGMPDDEKIFFESVCWQIAKYLNKLDKSDSGFLTKLFENIRPFPFSKPSDAYTFLLKSFTKHSGQWDDYYDFVKWWGLENFKKQDFEKTELENGKTIISDVERIYIAIAKNLLRPPFKKEQIEEFLPVIAKLCKEHPEMQYPHYYYAKLLLATGDKEKFLSAFIPFARKKKRDFWVWDLLSEAFDKGDPRHFACLCRSLGCGAPVKFSLNVKERFAGLLIGKGMLPEAKHEIDEVIDCRNKENWRLTDNLKKWQSDEKIQAVTPVKSNASLYKKYAPQADKILYYDMPADIVVIEKVNTEKQVAWFVASKEKYGSFLYRHSGLQIKPGDILSVRFFEQHADKKSPNFFKVATIEITDKKPSEEIYKNLKGNIKIKPGNSFGFVGSVFIPPGLVAASGLKNRQQVECAAVLSFNKKKKVWGWKALKVVENEVKTQPHRFDKSQNLTLVKTVVVNIVSEQTVPNYLFIKQFKEQADIFLFITTSEMEQKSKTKILFETAGIPENNVRKIQVHEDELFMVKSELDKLGWKNKPYHCLVNITGGTKLMSNAVYEYFRQFNSRFFYVPIGKNIFKEVFEEQKAVSFPFSVCLNVEEYLKIQGIRFETGNLIFTREQCEQLFGDVKTSGYDLDHFPRQKLKKMGISSINNKQIYTKWFEEFLYYKIKNILSLKEGQIVTGVKLFEMKEEERLSSYSNDNELDIFFIYRNNPYLIEAKFSIGKQINTTQLNHYLFKLATVNKRFGLRASATLMTLGDFASRNQSFEEHLASRCRIMNIHFPFDRNDIVLEQNFKNRLLSFLR